MPNLNMNDLDGLVRGGVKGGGRNGLWEFNVLESHG